MYSLFFTHKPLAIHARCNIRMGYRCECGRDLNDNEKFTDAFAR